MTQSRTYRKAMNFIYGFGAAIVIIGALFKIQHITLGPLTGGIMLTVGLVVEAIVFTISAFETPDEEYDWSKVYPELEENYEESQKRESVSGMLSKKLDRLLQEANIDVDLMQRFNESINNFQGTVSGISSISKSIEQADKFNEQMLVASNKIEKLNDLYQIQAESIDKQTEKLGNLHLAQVENTGKQAELESVVLENTEKLKEKVENLTENLSSLNSVYRNMLSAMSNNMEVLGNLHLTQVENTGKQVELESVVLENTEKLKEQIEDLTENLSSLNSVYRNMLSAMSNNKENG